MGRREREGLGSTTTEKVSKNVTVKIIVKVKEDIRIE